jgi:hypothetical protein
MLRTSTAKHKQEMPASNKSAITNQLGTVNSWAFIIMPENRAQTVQFQQH